MEYAVRIVTSEPMATAVVAEVTTWEQMPQLWRSVLAEVWSFVRKEDLVTGHNVMLYQDDVPRVEIGVEVEGLFDGDGRVVSSSLPAGQSAMTVSVGEPSAAGLAAAHGAVVQWCAANGHQPTGVRWEIYGHWAADQDPALFEIEVHWLLQSKSD